MVMRKERHLSVRAQAGVAGYTRHRKVLGSSVPKGTVLGRGKKGGELGLQVGESFSRV